MKTKFLLATIFTALIFLGVSCVEDEVYRGPATIGSVTFEPAGVTFEDDVTVTAAIVDLEGVTSAKIKYKVNAGSVTEVAMTKGSGNTYSGVIPKQADGAEVAFTVYAENQAGIPAESSEQSYTVGAPPVDITNLVLNEIDGNSKAIELYNKGSVPISLEGVSLWKNDQTDAWWTGVAENGSIGAGEYVLVIQGNPDNPLLSGRNGISAKQNLRFELKAANGESLGVFLRGDIEGLGNSISDVAPNSYQRIPNGTGDWKIAAPTNGTANPATGEDIPQS